MSNIRILTEVPQQASLEYRLAAKQILLDIERGWPMESVKARAIKMLFSQGWGATYALAVVNRVIAEQVA